MKTYMRKRPARQEIEDVQELCRLCLDRPDKGVPIFKDGDICAAVAMRIMICVGLEMNREDSLPNIICTNCYEELERYYKFRRKCEVSYQKLKSHVLALKQKKNREQLLQHLEDKPAGESSEENTHSVLMYQSVEKKEPEATQIDEQPLDVNEEHTTERVIEMEEVQIPIQTAEENPDIGAFLSTILTELGILTTQGDGLVLQDQGITSFELETGDNEQLVLELVEEDDEEIEENAESKQLAVEQSTPDSVEQRDIPKPVALIHIKPKENNSKKSTKVEGAWCAQCGRVFSSRGVAARHARAHSGARPYRCTTCDKTFAQKAILERHMLVHLEVRPHACPQCDKTFAQRGALAAHARGHAPPHARALALHRCTCCDKVFLYASGLSRHMLCHSGRVFACSACDKQFKDRSSLLRHLRTVPHGAPGARARPVRRRDVSGGPS